MSATSTNAGSIIRSSDLVFKAYDGYEVARAVGPEIGATYVRLDVIRLSAGARWNVSDNGDENVAVVYSGTGHGTVGGQRRAVERASTMYAPTGTGLTVEADTDMRFYVWHSTLLPDRPTSAAPRLFGSLWDEETQLRNFAGTGHIEPGERIATMNFVFWPGTGSAQLCLHCGIQQPGETFSVHLHQASDDAFVAIEGAGQMYLKDRWYDVEEGDILFAPPTVLHGTRQPDTSPTAKRFVTCGGPVPFDTFLYDAAAVSSEVR